MPNLVKWEQCCGCGACATKCPKQAITMTANKEGFLHPIIDTAKCIECGACEKSCPGLMPAQRNNSTPKVFIVQHKDDAIRYQSTSGGAFTAIAEEVIRQGGVVFGAMMTEGLIVRHGCVDSVQELAKFRNSKYVQSDTADSYLLVKDLLHQGRKVCFSGTPCQINGLVKYLGKDYDNLITVDVVCKSVPSPLVFQKYLDYKKEKEGEISDVVFRDKKRGFLYCTMAHYKTHSDRLAARAIYRRGSESDEWLRLFLSGRISRHSCLKCQYQTMQRVADFTLGDIWETGHPELDDNKGSTLVYVWSEKGTSLFNEVKGHIRFVEYSFEKTRGIERNNVIQLRAERDQLFKDAYSLSPTLFFNKYSPDTMIIQIKGFVRKLIWRLHLHNVIRHMKHMIIHR